MTPEDRYEIATLASDLATKEAVFFALRQVNAAGRSPEETERLTIAFHIAETEYHQAMYKLDRAKERIATR